MEENNASCIAKDVKPKRLNLSKDNRAGLLNARSNFVPQSKTVVVTNRSVVPDSPEKSKLHGSLVQVTNDISSLRKLGSQLFNKYNNVLPKTNTIHNMNKTHNQAKSQFLLGTNTPKTSVILEPGKVQEKADPSSALKQIALNAHKSTFLKKQSRIQSNQMHIPLPAATNRVSSLSAKFRAKAQQTQSPSHPPRCYPANPLPASSRTSSLAHSSSAVHQSCRDTDLAPHQSCTLESVSASAVPASAGSGGLSAMLTSLGKSLLQPGSRGLSRTMRPPAGMFRSAVSQEYVPSENDLGVYDVHDCDAAQTVGHYLDSVISTTEAPSGTSSTPGGSASGRADTALDSTTTNAIAGNSSQTSKQQSENSDNFNNFVRKNLKSGGSSKKLNRSSSRVSMAKQRWLNRSDEQGGGGGQYRGKYSKHGRNVHQPARKEGESTDENRGTGSAYSQPRGLQQWGLDSLEMSLDYLALPKTENKISVPIDETELVDSDCELDIQQPTGSSVTTITTIEDDTKRNTVRDSNTVDANVPNNTKGRVHCEHSAVRTHQSSGQTSTAAERARQLRQTLTATLPASSHHIAMSSTADKVALRAAARQRENERISAMAAHAPRCPGHSMAAKLLVVKKSGPNKGRYFYSCTYPAEQRCNFFMWAEDSPELLKHSAASSNSTVLPARDSHKDAQQAKLLYTTQAYAARLKGMTREELKQEVCRCNRRNALCEVPVKISVTGTKEDLVERLLNDAIMALSAGDGERGLEQEELLPVSTKARQRRTAPAQTACVPAAAPIINESASTDASTTATVHSSCNTTKKSIRTTEVENSADRETGNACEEAEVEGNESDREDEDEEELYFSDEGSVVVGAEVDCNLHSDSIDEFSTSDAELDGDRDSSSDTGSSSSSSEGEQPVKGRRKHANAVSNTTASDSRQEADRAVGSSEEDDLPSGAVNAKRARTAAVGRDLDTLDVLLRRNFGFSEFRPGQRWAIQRCLAGLSSLLVMPTGAGKSLCYMLPTLALPGLTLVVSPLVALMQDQQRKLPFGLPGACLSGALTAQQIMEISEAVLKGYIRVLYVSPERLCTPAFRRLIVLLKQQQDFSSPQPQRRAVVSLMCVDEAHCLSQWSYNFRPAFLRIRREIQFIQPASVLALTATATPRIQVDVMRHLSIPQQEGLLALPVRRDNLQVSVYTIANEEDRRKRIVDLVKTPHILETDTANIVAGDIDERIGRKRPRDTTGKNCANKLTIVYVWRRFEADALAEFLKGSGVTGVAVYHAGIDAATRTRTQLMFDRGQVRCIVATVAFGMGVDKADVRQVIHCTMPKSIESYMQEIGRAGRDGLPSACHLMLHRDDAVLQHSLSHSMQLSRIQIAALLSKVFKLNDIDTAKNAPGIHQYIEQSPLKPQISLLLEPLEAAIDISSTVVETIMSVLELSPYNLLAIEGTHYDTVKGRFRSTVTEALAQEDVLVAALIAANTYKPPKANTDFDFLLTTTGKSAHETGEAYGLGFDSSASATNRGTEDGQETAWQRDRRLGGTYGGKILEFECSRLAVALHCQLTPEEVSTGLYKLQKAGVLEYKLQDSALYIHTRVAGVGEFHFTQYCAGKGYISSNVKDHKQQQALYYEWLWQLSAAVQESLHTIETGGSSRIVDMWRATHTISCFTAQASNIAERATAIAALPCTPAAVHCAAQTLLSYVMSDADSSNSSTALAATMAGTGSEEESLSASMLNMYLTTPGPFSVSLCSTTTATTSNSNSKESSTAAGTARLREQVRDTVLVLQRDPSVMTAVNCILKSCIPVLAHHNSLQHKDRASNTDTSVTYAKKMLVSLCICRILHGLPTKLFPMGVWRDRSEAWGSCKHIQFDELFDYVSKVLLS